MDDLLAYQAYDVDGNPLGPVTTNYADAMRACLEEGATVDELTYQFRSRLPIRRFVRWVFSEPCWEDI